MAATRRPNGEAPCRLCGTPILFRKGPSGKVIPIQRVRVLYTMDAAMRAPVPLERDELRSYWVNHFESCSRGLHLRQRAHEGEEPKL